MLLPAQQIGGTGVTPMDVAMPWCVRVVLEEDVISAVDEADAVRVVDPAAWWADVQGREDGIVHG